MQLTTIVSLLALASATLAAPGSQPPSKGQHDSNPSQDLVTFWDEADFLGLRIVGNAKFNECKNFKPNFTKRTTSAKAIKGRCSVFVEKDCRGEGFTFVKSGVSDLPNWIDNKSQSWKCLES